MGSDLRLVSKRVEGSETELSFVHLGGNSQKFSKICQKLLFHREMSQLDISLVYTSNVHIFAKRLDV